MKTMRILLTANFENQLKNIIGWIAERNNESAAKFYFELMDKIADIPTFPYSYRVNLELERDDVRDLIFKKHVITFQIASDEIRILAVKGKNLLEIDLNDLK